jgi:hypothetical protein
MDVSNGFTVTQFYSLKDDSVWDSIPEWQRELCEDDISGTEAVQAGGNMAQSFSANCLVEPHNDHAVTTYRSASWNLMNGSAGSASIIYHANGTVEATCDMYQLKSSSDPASNCFGPKYHDDMVFDGTVTYGSLKVERYRITDPHQGGWMRNAPIDIDVDNGCLPIRSGPIGLTNFVNSDPPDSLFAIPPECFQHGAKTSGPVRHPKGILWSLKAMRRSSVV